MALVIHGLLLLLCTDVTSAVSDKHDGQQAIAIFQSSVVGSQPHFQGSKFLGSWVKNTDKTQEPSRLSRMRLFRRRGVKKKEKKEKKKQHSQKKEEEEDEGTNEEITAVEVASNLCQLDCNYLAEHVKKAQQDKKASKVNLAVAVVGTLLGGATQIQGFDAAPGAIYSSIAHGRGVVKAWKVKIQQMKAVFQRAKASWTPADTASTQPEVSPEKAKEAAGEMCEQALEASNELYPRPQWVERKEFDKIANLVQQLTPAKAKRRNAKAGFALNHAGLALTCASISIMVVVAGGVALTWPVSLPFAAAGLVVGIGKMSVAVYGWKWSSNDQKLFEQALKHCQLIPVLPPGVASLDPGFASGFSN